MDNTPPPPPPPLPLPPPTPIPIPLSLSPPTPTSYVHNHKDLLLPFPPPTTPISSSPTASLRKKRHSKLLRIDTSTSTTPANKKNLRSHHHARSVGKPFGPGRLFSVICDATPNVSGVALTLRLIFDVVSLPPTPTTTTDDHEVAASLLLLAAGPVSPDVALASPPRFECSSCKKTFGSHQALGGHRASHKNVKGCFAITKSAT
uniref:C2H2-type domain-containing protein n=1 Tax=Chenopodium quinoa TaxID=63459 RepID=A0A803NDM9_CHEQI